MSFVANPLIFADSPIFKLNAQKVEIFRWLNIIRSVKIESGPELGFTTLSYKLFRNPFRKEIKYHFSFGDGGVYSLNACREQLIKIVEEINLIPKEASILIQRILDGKIVRTDLKGINYQFDNRSCAIYTLKKDCSHNEWIEFFQTMERNTRYTEESKTKILDILCFQLGVYMKKHPESDSLVPETYVYKDSMNFTLKEGEIFTEPSFHKVCRNDKVFDFVMDNVSKPALAVAELIYEGVISDVTVFHKMSLCNDIIRTIRFKFGQTYHNMSYSFHICDKEQKDFKIVRNVDKSFEDVLIMVKNLQSAAPSTTAPVEIAPVVVSKVTASPATSTAPVPTIPDSPISFGRSRDCAGIYKVVDPDECMTEIAHLGPDGCWTRVDDRKTMAFKCIFYALEESCGPHPWIEAAFHFPQKYDPFHRYIVFADCDPKDHTHPAVVFYQNALNMVKNLNKE